MRRCDYRDAETQFLEALGEAERSGRDDNCVAARLNNLATVYRRRARYLEAERALSIGEKQRPQVPSDFSQRFENYARLLRDMGRAADATRIETRAATFLGPPRRAVR